MSLRRDDPCETPVLQGLLRYRERDFLSFHTPGHKRGVAAPAQLREALGAMLDVDMCLMPGLEDSRQRAGCLRAGERLAAEAWGASRAFFLTNGSSGGLHTLAVALAPRGSTVIVPRNAHKALLAGLILSGATPVSLAPEVDREWGFPLNVPAEGFETALAEHHEAVALFVSSPSYNGCCADVATPARSAHALGVVVAVDQAWGAHLRFCSALPEDAVSLGADVVVTSIHKLLSGVSQASLIAALDERVDVARLGTLVDMLRSTSLLAPILASIDAARMQMVTCGETLWADALELAESARGSIRRIRGLRCMGEEILERTSVVAFDRTRLTVSAADLGWAGHELEWELRERHGIAVETADALNVVMNITYADTRESVDRLVKALAEVAARGPLVRTSHGQDGSAQGPATARESLRLALPPLPRHLMTPREAFFAPRRPAPLRDCAGEVSAELAAPYPPGVPVLGPGEEITPDIVAFLQEARRRGVVVNGPEDRTLRTLQVVARSSNGVDEREVP